MEIIITRQNSDELLQINAIKWKLFTKKNVQVVFLYAFIGAVILVVNWISLKKGESFWRFESSFGLGILFLSLFYFIHFYKNKIRFLAKTKELISKYKNESGGIEIKITNSAITYRDVEIYSDMKWTVFSEYKLYNGYLILLIDNLYLSSIIINRNEISEAEFTELFDFVKSKMPEKK